MVAGVTSQTAAAGEVAPAQFDNATENPYRNAWDSVAEKFGQDTAGRHIVALGWRNAETGSVREPTRQEVVDATERLRVALNPPAPEPVAAPETTTAVTPTSTGSTSWDAVAACESSGDWSISTGNGYYGGLQFDSGTWDAYGDPSCAEASDCSRDAQIAAASSMPYDGWPNC